MTTGRTNTIVARPLQLESKSRFLERPTTLIGMFLGEDLLAWLTLAIGGALAFGTLAALVRPPANVEEGNLERAPLGRSLIQIVIGLIASAWALASLLS